MFDSRDELIHAATYIADKNNTMDELYHHGILGMKWGVRRYQNEDGSYTEEGRRHYGMDINDKDTRKTKKMKTDYKQLSDEDFKKKYWTTKDKYKSKVEKYGDPIKHNRKVKNIITAVGAFAVGAAATAGAVKIGRMVLDELASDPDFRDKWGNVEVWRNVNDQGQRAFKNVMEDVIFKNTSKPPIHGVPVPQYNMLRNGPRLSAQRGPLRLTKNRRRTFQDYIDGIY